MFGRVALRPEEFAPSDVDVVGVAVVHEVLGVPRSCVGGGWDGVGCAARRPSLMGCAAVGVAPEAPPLRGSGSGGRPLDVVAREVGEESVGGDGAPPPASRRRARVSVSQSPAVSMRAPMWGARRAAGWSGSAMPCGSAIAGAPAFSGNVPLTSGKPTWGLADRRVCARCGCPHRRRRDRRGRGLPPRADGWESTKQHRSQRRDPAPRLFSEFPNIANRSDFAE